MEGKTFEAGTMARCNRCDRRSPLPRSAYGVRENARAWRLQDMRTLGCGHMDAHWVYDQDNKRA